MSTKENKKNEPPVVCDGFTNDAVELIAKLESEYSKALAEAALTEASQQNRAYATVEDVRRGHAGFSCHELRTSGD